MTGDTRESALKKVMNIDEDKVFKNQKDFDQYLASLRGTLNNQRVFKENEIQVFYSKTDPQTGITPVELLIRTVDTWNFIAVPFPKYNSNTGAEIKLKFRNYNFLGSMQMFDLDFRYNYNTAENPAQHIAGLDTGFAVPFKLGSYDATWNNELNINQVIAKNTKPYFYYGTGLNLSMKIDKKSSLSYGVGGWFKHETNGDLYYSFGGSMSYSRALNDVISLGLSFSQYYYHSPKYKDDIDYINDTVSLSFPMNLGSIPDFGGVSWTPSASLSWNWDVKALNQSSLLKTDMIDHPDLKGPTLTFGHSIGSGNIGWVGNFRKGFTISLAQNWQYNLHTKAMPMPYFTLNTQLHLPSEYIALYNRNYWYYSMTGSTTTFGDRMRGIRDSDSVYSDNIIVFNFDFPIKIVQTDWVGWGFPAFMKNVDFELQISPFVDIALGHNMYTNTNFLIADGFYSGGIEILGYPTHMRSIVGRISFGIDASRTILPGRIVNKDWRPGLSKYELFMGLGIFY